MKAVHGVVKFGNQCPKVLGLLPI